MTVTERRDKRIEIAAEVIILVIGLTAAAAGLSTLVPGVLWTIQWLPLGVPGIAWVLLVVAMGLAAFVKRGDLVEGGFAVLLLVWVMFLGQAIGFALVLVLFGFS
ncbi:hypothetical protein RU09_12495 [Microbacterium sp. MEJ108Y]|nr:hypothetical protein RU09_12495 [Microbacterium sp. MEJ108Y]